jgi:formylglycine-generating enzyme required for sulfatase activity
VNKQTNKYEEGMTIKSWSKAGLLGYRLPLEAEWEFACRAGTKTRWSCGDSKKLLTRYARFESATIGIGAVGSLKPNDWGLFEMHGNALEWCQDAYEDQLSVDFASELTIFDSKTRVLRGGGFYILADGVRSADRHQNFPGVHQENGFRVARTYP